MKNKIELIIPCKVITPMFSNGAQANFAQIRRTQILAGMRDWFRLFNLNDWQKVENDESKLFSNESKLFGNTQKAASFQFDLEDEKSILKSNFFNTYKPDVKFDRNGYSGAEYGIAYLFYTKNLGANKNASFIEPESSFNINISAFCSSQEEISQCLITPLMCLYALSVFGAVGSRQTRGAGNFSINLADVTVEVGLNSLLGKKNTETFDLFLKRCSCNELKAIKKLYFTTNETLEGYISRLIPVLKELISINNDKELPFKSGLFTLSEDTTDHASRPRWFQLLNEAGKLYATYRHNIGLESQAAFGLPLLKLKIIKSENYEPFSTKITNENAEAKLSRGKVKIEEAFVRRKSQLIFTICEFDKKIYLIVYKLEGAYLPEDCILINYNYNNQDKPEYINEITVKADAITEFMQTHLIQINIAQK